MQVAFSNGSSLSHLSQDEATRHTPGDRRRQKYYRPIPVLMNGTAQAVYFWLLSA